MNDRPTINLRPKPKPTCTYGGTCDKPAVMTFDRIDSMGARVTLACTEHEEAMRFDMARYIHGWGMVTLIVYPVDETREALMT